MIQLDNLKFSYNDKEIFRQHSLTIDQPGLYGLIGRNGAGKSTLFDILRGHLKAQSGQLNIPSQKLNRIALLGQSMSFPTGTTVLECVQFFFIINDLEIDQALVEFKNLMANNSTDKWNKIKETLYSQLSSGERQWLKTFLILTLQKDVYLLDEPTDSVDPEFSLEIWNAIKCRLQENSHIIVIVSSHILSELNNYVENILFLKDGQIIRFNSIQEFIGSYSGHGPDDAFVKAHLE